LRIKRRAFLFLLTLSAAWVASLFYLDIQRGRERRHQRATFQAITELANAIEESPNGARLCVRTIHDLSRDTAIRVPQNPAYLDGWGRELLVVASPRRYIIASLGADGLRDPEWHPGPFDDPNVDIVYSDGEFLRFPSGLETAPGLPPRPADALAEALRCTDPPRRERPRFYLYLPSERDALSAAGEIRKLGFSSEVRRAVGQKQWLCVASSEAMTWQGEVALIPAASCIEDNYQRVHNPALVCGR
jgi:hypothetical protein